ncbi:RuvC-like resolvase [Microbacterium phage Fullmetal]|nr:RuvC-like resolvase [Microbacterium phage Fullmetal]
MKLTLLGVDPGVRDTGAVALVIDPSTRQLEVVTRVWNGVIQRDGFSVSIDEAFLLDLARFERGLRGDGPVLSGVEGYRPRGKNSRQDEEMTQLVQNVRATLPHCRIIDNTGIKDVVTQDLLQLFWVSRFKQTTNHADLKSAARVALKIGIDGEATNILLSDYVRDNVFGGADKQWSLVSSPTQ